MVVYQRLCQNVMWPFSMDSVYSNLCSHPTIQIVPQKFVAKLADTPCSAVSASSPINSPIFTALPWMWPLVHLPGLRTCPMRSTFLASQIKVRRKMEHTKIRPLRSKSKQTRKMQLRK